MFYILFPPKSDNKAMHKCDSKSGKERSAKNEFKITLKCLCCHQFSFIFQGCHRDSCKFLHISKDQEDCIRTSGSAPPGMSEHDADKLMGLVSFAVALNL